MYATERSELHESKTRMTGDQLVAFNLRRVREQRGWTQKEAAERLEPFLGVRWSSGTFSIAENSYRPGRRRRRFHGDDVLAFALCFDVPVAEFWRPPGPSDELGDVIISPDAAPDQVGLDEEGQMRLLIGGDEPHRHREQELRRLEEALEQARSALEALFPPSVWRD
jgi:transcriptional regulator with XRE-family HTH domain